MRKFNKGCVVIMMCILISGISFGWIKAQVVFPEDYRSWTRVKSAIILEGHEHFDAFGGFHHIYANEKAFQALKRGDQFSSGAVFVFELFDAVEENNSITEGKRKVIGVMEKDPVKFPDTAGWGFEDFKMADPNQRLVTDMRKQCLSCHESQRANDYVYSTLRKSVFSSKLIPSMPKRTK